jgi:hypothetical protein
MTKEVLKLALEALETNNKAWRHLADSGDAGFWEAEEQGFYELSVKAITTIKEALAQTEHGWTPERIAGMVRLKEAQDKKMAQQEQPKVRTGNCLRVGVCASEGHKIAPQRTWVGLTLGEQGDLYSEYSENPALLYRAIEAKLKEKNVPKA